MRCIDLISFSMYEPTVTTKSGHYASQKTRNYHWYRRFTTEINQLGLRLGHCTPNER